MDVLRNSSGQGGAVVEAPAYPRAEVRPDGVLQHRDQPVPAQTSMARMLKIVLSHHLGPEKLSVEI